MKSCFTFLPLICGSLLAIAQGANPNLPIPARQQSQSASMAFPTSATTGVPDGVKLLPSGGIVVTKPGTVLEGLDIRGQVYIKADNVTLKNCKITTKDFYVVRIDKGIQGAVVQNCDIDGQGGSGTGIGGAGTFLGNDIRGVVNGINLEGAVGSKIIGNYIHDFRGGPDEHFDGIQIFGDVGTMKNIEIAHNTIINDGSPIGVSAIFVANTFGPVDNVSIHHNYLSSPGNFPVYNMGTYTKSPITNVTWSDNYVVKGYYGYEKITADSQGRLPTMTNNTNVDKGLPPEIAPDSYSANKANDGSPPTSGTKGK